MTRKDYVLIADCVNNALMWNPYSRGEMHADIAANAAYRVAIERVARELADSLRGTNDLFDRGRFLRACGVES
jgi:hypothetical protein